MINLLPKDQLKDLRASRHNVILLRYLILLFLAIGLIAATFVYMYITLDASKTVAMETKRENEQRVKTYDKTNAEAQVLNKSLNQVKGILSQRVDYSKVLVRIAQVLPANVTIQSIQLESKLFEGTKTLRITAPNLDSVIATKTAFEASQLFTSVKIDDTNESKDQTHATFSLMFNRKGFEL